jgi:hypothetical protein
MEGDGQDYALEGIQSLLKRLYIDGHEANVSEGSNIPPFRRVVTLFLFFYSLSRPAGPVVRPVPMFTY